jgi:hypothetical protein
MSDGLDRRAEDDEVGRPDRHGVSITIIGGKI